jgi:hypothetical protein
LITVCNIQRRKNPYFINDLKVSDLDYADIIMEKEPTFGGEAEIKPEIIECSAIDCVYIPYIFKN